ncbi:MAG: beta-lactamase family protein [Candidatus Eremiobacteraeota bacterium]|nr:beta-lactamase family protein [Candidatus Eremiobacteraeota bacterium]
MIRRHFIASSAAALAGAVAAPEAAFAEDAPLQLSAAQRSPIEEAVAKAMAATETRGVSVTVARGGTIVYANGFGQRDVGAKLPVDADTVFPIGSITKQFTAASIMLLARDGKVTLDAPAARYVPRAPHGNDYTVRNLLQQTTGLANFTAVPGFLQKFATSTTITPAELLALIANAPLGFAPGTRYEYSNTNYLVLGMIVEAVSGIPYARFVHERIAVPLGLTHLTFGPPPDDADVARGYEAQTGTAAVTPWTAQATFSAGALYATPADLVRWDEAFFGGRLLDASTVRAMTTPPQLPGGAKTVYAMGWLHEQIDGHTMIWHNGGVIGANTRNAYFPDQHIAIVVFGNSVGFDETAIVRAAFRAVVPPSEAQLAQERQSETTPAAGEDAAITTAARAEYERWRAGQLDTTNYDKAMRAAMNDATVRQVSAGLAALGAPTTFVFRGKQTLAGGVTAYVYRVNAPNGAVRFVYSTDADGKVGGIFFTPVP